jgi:uncharacterized protein (TIGR03905 family)
VFGRGNFAPVFSIPVLLQESVMNIQYQTEKTCAHLIDIQIDGDIVTGVCFTGGCSGNAQGVSALAKNRPVCEVVELLRGIDCGGKGTSCPDQLARALQKEAVGSIC